jgi:hypothetical protein
VGEYELETREQRKLRIDKVREVEERKRNSNQSEKSR